MDGFEIVVSNNLFMETPKLSRRTAGKIAALSIATLGGSSLDAGANSGDSTPGTTGSKWLLFVPDSNQPSTTVLMSAVDANGITRATAVNGKLTLVIETTRSTYAIIIQFDTGGDPSSTLSKILSGELRDIRKRSDFKISSIKITDASGGGIPTKSTELLLNSKLPETKK